MTKSSKNSLSYGIIEKVKGTGTPGETHYLPHHAVQRNDKTRGHKGLRVVFDAKLKPSSSKPSLNDCLYKQTTVDTPSLRNPATIIQNFL